MSTPLEVFCCYAHADQDLLEGLKKHLISVQRQGKIKIWSDTDIYKDIFYMALGCIETNDQTLISRASGQQRERFSFAQTERVEQWLWYMRKRVRAVKYLGNCS
jgi:hypothetical protein